MKLRVLIICLIALLGVTAAVLFWPQSEPARDMVYYASRVEGIARGGQVPEGCEVISIDDPYYVAKNNEALKRNAVVMDIIEDGVITGKAIFYDHDIAAAESARNTTVRNIVILAVIAAGGAALIAAVYVRFLRPFNKLEKFAGEVAKGNLDFPLEAGRGDFFGSFTESFDLMREELLAARVREADAQKAKQEMLAELSHDIRTPLATINATCEVLEVKSGDDDVRTKAGVIRSKVGTIDSLIANLMSASLDEASELSVTPAENSSLLIAGMFDNLKDAAELNITDPVPECLLYFDPLRLEQVIDNIVGNSIKYAGTPITVSFSKTSSGVVIRISDEGPGVPEDELSLLTQKFYRGGDAKGKPGSGLGLFLADSFMKKMEGDLNVYNGNKGFVAEVFVRKV
ncbi:MAG: HAMP domain-containing histidine kinase [Clostridiales bacterium]|nr:HAMP domain-containing histidine kinase [Clostridiales bacterium]